MENKFKKPGILLGTAASICMIAVAVFMAYGFLGDSKADNSNQPINYGNVDNTSHSNSSKANITNSDTKLTYSSIKGGATLQAWCWSFNTIAENMESIHNAGYTSIQTSPINKCRIGENNKDYSLNIQKWYFHYQPTDYTIGNYQLGTEAEFKNMCKKAKQYGISIIVDAVMNHMTMGFEYIDSSLQKPEYYHNNTKITDWDSRYGITQFSLVGLWDLNTANQELQQKQLTFLKQCVSDGADGFRYDAAKHIELPDDNGIADNFWPTILNNGAKFQYGEVLGNEEKTVRANAYTKLMDINYDGYGYALRKGVSESNLNSMSLVNYNNAPVDPSNLILWVESHDTYCNEERETTWLTDEQIKLAWAAVASRNKGTPLFYSRPVGGGGTTYDSRFPALSKIGDAGSDLYRDDEVAAVNIFKNEMEGENEYLRNINGNSMLMIDRGTKGSVIINLNYTNQNITSDTNLANGTYTSHTDDASVFSVNNGKISGTVPARGVVVLYNNNANSVPAIGIEGYKPSSTTYFENDYLTLNLKAENVKTATYKINDGESYVYTNNDSIYVGWGVATKTNIKVTLTAVSDAGVIKTSEYTFVKRTKEGRVTLTFEKPAGWGEDVFVYVYNSTCTWVDQVGLTDWPGMKMNKVNGNTYTVEFDEPDFADRAVIFTDQKNQSPAAEKPGFNFKSGGTYTSSGLK